jgi:fatty acid desaturase
VIPNIFNVSTNMIPPSTVADDTRRLRNVLFSHTGIYEELTRRRILRPLLDLIFDWALIGATVLGEHLIGALSVPLAILVIGNRQRALGNVLHDAAHRNLSQSSRMNDLIASALITPALFVSLAAYRDIHARHHAWLGDPRRDPDYIDPASTGASTWWRTYCRYVTTPSIWLSSIFGHLLRFDRTPNSGACRRDLAIIAVWWASLLGSLTFAVNIQFAIQFVALWMVSKATTFHCITTFREMCDHYPLRPGGVFSFTRDIRTSSPWRWVVHPRNNAYHLTHHLLPTIPYYQLPKAHAWFRTLWFYSERASVCSRYFSGPDAVVHDWICGER